MVNKYVGTIRRMSLEKGMEEAKKFKNRIFSWMNDILHWLEEGKDIFLCFLAFLFAVSLCMLLRNEPSIRLAGTFLQAIGMIFAIQGLLGVMAHFGEPPLRQHLVNWLERRPKWKKSHVLRIESKVTNISNGKAKLDVWTQDYPDKQLETRIEGIIKNLSRIKEEQEKHANSIEELQDCYRDLQTTVIKENKNTSETIHSELKSLHTGNAIKSLGGLLLIMIGIIISTLAPEFNDLFFG